MSAYNCLMKSFVLKILLLCGSVLTVFPQENQQAESQKMNQQIVSLYKQNKFDEAIVLAEKLIESEKSKKNYSANYVIYLKNIVALRKERFLLLQNKTKAISEYKPKEREQFFKAIADDIKKSELALVEAIDVNSNLSKKENLMDASLKMELAWVLNHSTVRPVKIDIENLYRKIQSLYLQALTTQEKLSSSDSNETLKTVLTIGDFYKAQGDFEDALTYYERYIEAVEKRYGSKHVYLVPALSNLGEIWINTDRKTEAQEIAKRIAVIDGKPEIQFPSYPNLINRVESLININYNSFIESFPDIYGRTSLGNVEILNSARNKLKIKSFRIAIVQFKTDERGNVIEAKALITSSKKEEIEKNILKSKFRPFIHNGIARKMLGSINYIYAE